MTSGTPPGEHLHVLGGGGAASTIRGVIGTEAILSTATWEVVTLPPQSVTPPSTSLHGAVATVYGLPLAKARICRSLISPSGCQVSMVRRALKDTDFASAMPDVKAVEIVAYLRPRGCKSYAEGARPAAQCFRIMADPATPGTVDVLSNTLARTRPSGSSISLCAFPSYRGIRASYAISRQSWPPPGMAVSCLTCDTRPLAWPGAALLACVRRHSDADTEVASSVMDNFLQVATSFVGHDPEAA